MEIPRLREWRERRGYTQRGLASESGVSERSIAGYEAGHSTRPNTAHKLALVLEIAPEDMMDFEGEHEMGKRGRNRPKEGPPPPSDSGGTGEYRRIADSIPMPETLDSVNVVDVAREAVLADKRRNKQLFARLEESGQGQIIYGGVAQELERRLGEWFAELGLDQSFFGGFMYSGLLNSVRRTLELEEENARLKEELERSKEHAQ